MNLSTPFIMLYAKGVQFSLKAATVLEKPFQPFPLALPVAIEKKLKILYVARTHRQHDRVIEELRAIYRQHQLQEFPFVDAMKCASTFLLLEELLTRNRLWKFASY